MSNDDQTNTNEAQFAHDLMKAGYEKEHSDGENNFLRKYDLSRDEQLSDDKNRVYKNNVTGKAYIVYPGTKDFRDMGTDLALLFGFEKKTPRFNRAHQVADQTKKKRQAECHFNRSQSRRITGYSWWCSETNYIQ